MNKRQRAALGLSNLDLFRGSLEIEPTSLARPPVDPPSEVQLPTVTGLKRLFEQFNNLYFNGSLPPTRIEYSDRLLAAGSYIPSQKTIRIGRKYHVVYPGEVADTLKHEMIHIRHLYHDAVFKAEAERVGASLRARAHPELRRPPKYIYVCSSCGREYPRQKRLRMASCGICTKGRRFDPRFKLRLKSGSSRGR
jgi:predicted SprT family Zn-dependent metalloprotease